MSDLVKVVLLQVYHNYANVTTRLPQVRQFYYNVVLVSSVYATLRFFWKTSNISNGSTLLGGRRCRRLFWLPNRIRFRQSGFTTILPQLRQFLWIHIPLTKIANSGSETCWKALKRSHSMVLVGTPCAQSLGAIGQL